ncbi:hypothetical protein EYF80_000132 [Liparis tanakae]|uniref:Uncharacterized protein n=1 Tax=Liparis tanakae TaxID=230148 RepID=A0A4Z2JGV0_9TELE|nr:hypothetical protein EYF80_000132 [Liparis tanakae]
MKGVSAAIQFNTKGDPTHTAHHQHALVSRPQQQEQKWRGDFFAGFGCRKEGKAVEGTFLLLLRTPPPPHLHISTASSALSASSASSTHPSISLIVQPPPLPPPPGLDSTGGFILLLLGADGPRLPESKGQRLCETLSSHIICQ